MLARDWKAVGRTYSKPARSYDLRWTIETAIGHLKTTMRMDVLRCQTVRGIEKELSMFLLVYNLVRMTMLEAARRQGVPPERISFVDALRWLATARPGEELPQFVVDPLRPRANARRNPLTNPDLIPLAYPENRAFRMSLALLRRCRAKT